MATKTSCRNCGMRAVEVSLGSGSDEPHCRCHRHQQPHRPERHRPRNLPERMVAHVRRHSRPGRERNSHCAASGGAHLCMSCMDVVALMSVAPSRLCLLAHLRHLARRYSQCRLRARVPPNKMPRREHKDVRTQRRSLRRRGSKHIFR